MTGYTESEEKIKRLRDSVVFPDPWDLLRGMIDPKNRTNLQRETMLKIQELIEKEGFDVAHRVMASVLGYGFSQREKEGYRYGHFGLFRRMLLPRHRNGTNYPPRISGRHYVDHYYGIKDKTTGSEYIILEPYGITSEDLKQLIRECDDNKLEFTISGDSIHFTGWTIKIKIGEKKGGD
jgi:hypothetical protein